MKPTWTYSQVRGSARRTREQKIRRARELSAEAGLSPRLLGIHPYNAMNSYKAGKPWQGVDYSLVRKILWILKHQFDADRIADRYCEKMRRELGIDGYYKWITEENKS